MEGILQLGNAHAANTAEPFQRQFIRTVGRDEGCHIGQPYHILRTDRTAVLAFQVPLCHQRHRLRHLPIIKQTGGKPLPPVVAHLFQELHHFWEVFCLIQRLKRLQQALILLGKLAAQIIPVVSRGDLHANGNDGDLPVDERPVWFPTSDKTFDTAWNKTATGGELLPGNGFIPGDTETLRPMELQQLLLMEKEIMDLDGIEILLPVGPEKPPPCWEVCRQHSPMEP